MRFHITSLLGLLFAISFHPGYLLATDIIDTIPYYDNTSGEDYLADNLICAAESTILADSGKWSEGKVNAKEKSGLLLKLEKGAGFLTFDKKKKQIRFNNNSDKTFTIDLISSTDPLDFYTGNPTTDQFHRYFISHFKFKNLLIINDTKGLSIPPTFVMLTSYLTVYRCRPYNSPK